MARKIEVTIVGDSRSLERAFDRSARSARQFNAEITAVSRGLGTAGFLSTAGAVAAGAAAIGIAFRTGFREMRESRKVAAQTAAAIESTGGVAGVTAEHVRQLSDQMLRLSGVDDELIGSAQNLLLTFTNVRNVVGEGNDIFDQATLAALNLSTRMGTDLQGAALQVGKALQDPIRGMTALRRAGVLLTVAQEKQIRRLVESGRLMDAQKLLLRELATEFGGSAAAAGEADAGLDRLQRTIENFLGMVVEKFLPNIESATTALQEWFDDPRNVKRVTDDVTAVAGAFADVTKAADEANSKGDEWAGKLQDGATKAGLQVHLGLIRPLENLPSVLGSWAKREREETIRELRALSHEGQAIVHTFANALSESLQLKGRGAAATGGAAAPGTAPAAAARRGPGATQRNRWFDAALARQLNRLQDLSLRKQLAGLRAAAADVRARLAATTDATRRLTLEDRLLGILREQRSVQAQIADEIRAANEALKDRADAIKSAVIERLQRRQTDILNKRALADAQEQLRIARQIGGPAGVRAAQRGLQDVRFDIMRAQLENAPASLTGGGRFALAGVVINVNGVTDPDEVARKVAAVLQKRARRTTTQTRGPAAGARAGAH